MRPKMVDLGAASVVPYVHQDQVQLLQACKASYSFNLLAMMTNALLFALLFVVRGACTPENT